jgi:hypothetical protein
MMLRFGVHSFGSPNDVRGPISRLSLRVKLPVGCLPAVANLRSGESMEDRELNAAFDRAERALQRIERALAAKRPAPRDEELRAKVREVVEELDELIRAAAA